MTFSQHLRPIAEDVWIAQLTHPFVVRLATAPCTKEHSSTTSCRTAASSRARARVCNFGKEIPRDADWDDDTVAQLVEETSPWSARCTKIMGSDGSSRRNSMGRSADGPDKLGYTRHMLHVAENGSVLDATVVALPCAWIYCVVGRHLLRKACRGNLTPIGIGLCSKPLRIREVGRWMREKVDAWSKSASQVERGRLEGSVHDQITYEGMFWEMHGTRRRGLCKSGWGQTRISSKLRYGNLVGTAKNRKIESTPIPLRT